MNGNLENFCRELDKYYTKPKVVDKCLACINDIGAYDFVVEPSAGSGVFLKKINNKNKIGIDVQPECKSVVRGNWFNFKVDALYKNVLVVGNPPFGKNHSLSDAFLRYAFSIPNVNTVAFILPNTYNKHNRQKIIPNGWRIKHIEELNKDSFELKGKSKKCTCSFFIFDRSYGRDLRINPDKITTRDFTFHKESGDFFIFGAAPNKIIQQPGKNNRGYFIKSNMDRDKLISRFKNIKWRGNSCSSGGVAWFTKLEIIQEYNRYYPPTRFADTFSPSDSNSYRLF